MTSNQNLLFLSAQALPSYFAYQMLVQAGSSAVINPIGGAICTAVASSILAKVGEYLGSSYLEDLIGSSRKMYVIPSIWVISSFLTTVTQFPLRFIAAISPVITLEGAITLGGLLSLWILNIVKPKSVRNSSQTLQQTNITSADASIDTARVVTAANRVLADIAELNRTRGVTTFPYTCDGDRELYHSIDMNTRLDNDKNVAIAALHQKIATHIDERKVTILPAERLNWWIREGDSKKTSYSFLQKLQDSRTNTVIASARFTINHTDQSTFPLFSRRQVNGKLLSEIVMGPFIPTSS